MALHRGTHGCKPACLHLNGEVRFGTRGELGDEPEGDELQAGPLLVRGGQSFVHPGADPEGRPVSTALAFVES